MLLSTGQFFGQATGPTYPLNGLSPTVACSLSRDLLSAYVGGTRYTDAGGGVLSVLNDQSGSARNYSQGTGANRPAIITAGPNSRLCADFDGSNDALDGAAALSALIANNSGFAIASVIIDTFPTNSATVYQNSGIFMDSAVYAGLTVRSNGGSPLVYAYNYDGTADSAQASIVAATPYVLTWRHEGGNLYVGVNGVESSATASGNTQVMTGTQRLGYASGSIVMDGKLFEFATFSTVPSSGDRSTLITNMMNWIGA